MERTLVTTRGRRCQWALKSRRRIVRTSCRMIVCARAREFEECTRKIGCVTGSKEKIHFVPAAVKKIDVVTDVEVFPVTGRRASARLKCRRSPIEKRQTVSGEQDHACGHFCVFEHGCAFARSCENEALNQQSPEIVGGEHVGRGGTRRGA